MVSLSSKYPIALRAFLSAMTSELQLKPRYVNVSVVNSDAVTLVLELILERVAISAAITSVSEDKKLLAHISDFG